MTSKSRFIVLRGAIYSKTDRGFRLKLSDTLIKLDLCDIFKNDYHDNFRIKALNISTY